MGDLWELTQYVESHPDNKEQRWRLAKKLFLTWEYRLALEHLQILKNEWGERLNVRRYLAATYYRMTRYDDAIRELEEAAQQWPEDIALREQLARTLQSADRKLDASEVWSEVAERNPKHSFAKKAVQILREEEIGQDGPKVVVPSLFSTPGPTSTSDELECPHCGAKNDPEFQRCWQCHGPLESAPTYRRAARRAEVDSRETVVPWPLISGLSIVALLTVGIYMTLRHFYPSGGAGEGAQIPSTLHEFFAIEMAMTRIILGLALVVAWPVSLRFASVLVGFDDIDQGRLNVAGLFLAALTYAVSWLPPSQLLYAPILPVAASLVIALAALGLRYGQAALVWVIQGALVILVMLTILAAMHGFGLVMDLPAVLRYANQEDGESTLSFTGPIPVQFDWQCETSGSQWLDERASLIGLTLEAGPIASPSFVEVEFGGESFVTREIHGANVDLQFGPVKPGRPYRVVVTGEEGVEVSLSLRSVFRLDSPSPP